MQTFNQTKVRYHENERDLEGNLKIYTTSEEAFNKAVSKATENKTELPVLVVKATGRYTLAESLGEALSLSGVSQDVSAIDDYIKDNSIDVSVFLTTFNIEAAKLKQHNFFADEMSAEGFQEPEDAINLGSCLAEKYERTKQSPTDKALKALGMSAEELKEALAFIRQQRGAGASA